MRIYYTKKAEKYLQRQTDETQIRIEKGIKGIPKGDIKKLKGEEELYRLRIGDVRVIFRKVDVDTVNIMIIDSRGDVYKK